MSFFFHFNENATDDRLKINFLSSYLDLYHPFTKITLTLYLNLITSEFVVQY